MLHPHHGRHSAVSSVYEFFQIDVSITIDYSCRMVNHKVAWLMHIVGNNMQAEDN